MSRAKIEADMKATMEQLRGKTIARVVAGAFDDGGYAGPGGVAYQPAVFFTDGSCLRFVVQETETGEYGVDFVYPARRK